MTQAKSKLELFKEIDFKKGDISLIYMQPQHAWILDDLPDIAFTLVDKETGDEERVHYALVYEPEIIPKQSFSRLQPYPPLISRSISSYFNLMLTEFDLVLKETTELRYIDGIRFLNEAFDRVMRQKYNPLANAVSRRLGTVFAIPVNGCGVIKIYPRPETSDSMFDNFASRNDQYDILRGAATFAEMNYSWAYANPHAGGFGASNMPSLMQEVQEVVFAAFPWLANGMLQFHSIHAVHPAEINFEGNGHIRHVSTQAERHG